MGCYQEGTQALREMLHIGESQRHDAQKQQARPAPVLHGKQLTLDELFSNQSKVKFGLAWNSDRSVAVVSHCQNKLSVNNYLNVKPLVFFFT